MKKDNIIECPKCGAEIDVNEVLYDQLEDQIKKSYDKKSAKRERELQQELDDVHAEKELLKKEKEGIQELIAKEVQGKLRSEKTKLEKSIRDQLQGETSERIEGLQKELEQKSTQVKELNKTKTELEKVRREKDEIRDQVILEKETEFTEKLRGERQKIKKQADEENTLKIKELEKKLDDQTKLAEEMKRKAEQGSMQSQGEIQELELEKLLRELYPQDEITEVKKGQRGADVLQVVRTQQGEECGKIYYESKRTKNFDLNWLQKLRDDNLTAKADALVLVTETMPEGADDFFLKEGFWVCTIWEVKGLSFVLRHGLLQVHSLSITQQGRGSKMEMLYSYLTSLEFKGQFEAIIEGFRGLQDGYLDEKLKMQKIWKEREKQLEKILSNAVSFYGSLKGIAGASIPDIKMLEGGSSESPDLAN